MMETAFSRKPSKYMSSFIQMVKKKDGKLRFKSNETQAVLVISGYFNDARELIEDAKNDEFISLMDEGRLGVNDIGEVSFLMNYLHIVTFND